jgi:hypothetical protein
MELFKEKINTWSILKSLGVVLGLISAMIAIYVFFFTEKKQELVYDILSDSSVLDINADVTNLDITYDGESLKKTGQSLRIITLRIKNSGTESILKTHYDSKDPLGLQISSGRIVEKPELVIASNEYLVNNLVFTVVENNKVFLNDIIIDSNESLVLKLLVLHPTGENPIVSPKGKVAGIKNIILNPLSQQSKEQPSFWSITFGGGISTHLVRAAAYFILVIIIFFIAGLSSAGISGLFDRRKRKRIVREFKALDTYDYSHMHDVIFESFKAGRDKDLIRYKDYLKNETKLNWRYRSAIDKLKGEDGEDLTDHQDTLDIVHSSTNYGTFSSWEITRNLIRDGYVINDGGTLRVNQPMKEVLNLFLEYLDEIKFEMYIPRRVRGTMIETEE